MKHALVTGASRGIGFEIVRNLLKESFRITGTARKSEFPPELKKNEKFTGIYADLGIEEDIKKRVQTVFTEDLPDVLINNAGMFQDADFSVSDHAWLDVWNRTMNVNLRSAAILSKWFINGHAIKGSEGIIINMSSRAAYRGDTQEYAAYAASKAGMVAFTKSVARDFGKKGIVAYSVAPGFIETDMARESVSVYGEAYLTKDSAFGEITQPGEVANLVAFLASGQVKHMTGSTFHINGGSYMI